MAEIGDIVLNNGTRFVVAEFFDATAPLIRKAPNGGTASLTVATSGLNVADTPVFENGERVTHWGVPGRVVETVPAQSVGGGRIVRVELDPRTHPLRGGGALIVENGVTPIPVWQLVLQNKL
jgi:hypothetical protein